jgi:hypothetical protein
MAAAMTALRIGGEAPAIAADYLTRHPVYHDRLGGTDLVVLNRPGRRQSGVLGRC